MDRNEMLERIIKSEIKREVVEISYEILKEYSQTTFNINHYFDTDDIIYLRGVKEGLDKALKLIEKRYTDE